MSMLDKDICAELQKKYPNVHIAYGGDGTLVNEWPIAKGIKNMPIFPIRDYGRCKVHEKMVNSLLAGTSLKDLSLKMTVNPLIECSWMIGTDGCQTRTNNLGLAEVQIKNKDITTALRFNVYVNGKRYYDNVIADSIVASTPLGSTGYWKSITRTIFREGFGVTFAAPTVGISSVVLKYSDKVTIEFARDASVILAGDKKVSDKLVNAGEKFEICMHTDNVSVIGYDHFMCYECRKNRNSTILQDQYIV